MNPDKHGTRLSASGWHVQILTKGHLAYWLNDCFGGLAVSYRADGSSLISGELPDMSAVYGLILQIRDMGLFLLSLRIESDPSHLDERNGLN